MTKRICDEITLSGFPIHFTSPPSFSYLAASVPINIKSPKGKPNRSESYKTNKLQKIDLPKRKIKYHRNSIFGSID